MKKVLWFLALTVVIVTIASVYLLQKIQFSPEPQPSQEKQIQVSINEDGTSAINIIWKINTPDIASEIPKGEWGITIPKNAQNIKVSDNKNNLIYRIQNKNSASDMLIFNASSNIYKNSDYFFNISYTLLNNPIAYGQDYLYQQTFTRFYTDEEFSLNIRVPDNAEIISEEDSLNPQFEKGETKTIKLEFKIPESKILLSPSESETIINSRYYQATLPKKYSEEYQKILNNADNAVEQIENIYDFQSPYKWQITLINQNEPDFEEQTEASYLSEGKIRIKITHLQNPEEKMLYTIIHETTHGFNSKFLKDTTPNSWWDEGTAQYVAYQSLENLGYNISNLKSQNIELITLCKNQDLSFISEWTPNKYLNNSQSIRCNNEDIDLIKLGYAQSYNIIKILVEKYSGDILKEFYSTSEELHVNFSSDHLILNNQINYILSQSAGQDTTPLLNSLGLNVQPITKEKTITGMNIYEKQKTNKYALLLLLAAIIILIILIKRKLFKPKKTQRKTRK